MIWVHHNICIVAAGNNRWYDKKGRSAFLDPGFAKGLRDRHIAWGIPSHMGGGDKSFTRYIIRYDRFDVPRGTWWGFTVGVDQNFDQANGETGSRVNCRQSCRIPTLAK
jgi:hypothetical protein